MPAATTHRSLPQCTQHAGCCAALHWGWSGPCPFAARAGNVRFSWGHNQISSITRLNFLTFLQMRSISLELEIPARQGHPGNTLPMLRVGPYDQPVDRVRHSDSLVLVPMFFFME